jgi:hypothetical protein
LHLSFLASPGKAFWPFKTLLAKHLGRIGAFVGPGLAFSFFALIIPLTTRSTRVRTKQSGQARLGLMEIHYVPTLGFLRSPRY